MWSQVVAFFTFVASLLPWNSPAELEINRNITYKVVEGRELKLDLVLPKVTAEPAPVVIFIHGGMWISGSKSHYPGLKRYLAEQGFACVAVEYGKWLSNGYYRQVQDIKDAIRWVRGNAHRYHLDPERIGMFGSSSGGHLASLAAYCSDEDFGASEKAESSEVQALFLLYGVYDLNGILKNPLVRELTGGFGPEDSPSVYEFFSPISHIDGTEPPTYIMHGTADRMVPVGQAEKLAEALRNAGVPVIFTQVWEGAHGFFKLKPATRPMTYQTVAHFFATELMKEPEETDAAA